MKKRAVKDYVKTFEEFWRPLVFKRGKLSMDAVMRELHDYAEMIREVAIVYDELTAGRISKPNTVASAVIGVHDDVCHRDCGVVEEAAAPTRERLLQRLRTAADEDPETGHIEADAALLEFIGDPEVSRAFESISKWYA